MCKLIELILDHPKLEMGPFYQPIWQLILLIQPTTKSDIFFGFLHYKKLTESEYKKAITVAYNTMLTFGRDDKDYIIKSGYSALAICEGATDMLRSNKKSVNVQPGAPSILPIAN